MKKRILFILSLLAFMSPMAALAQGERVPASSQTLCGAWKAKVLREVPKEAPATAVVHSSGPVKQSSGKL